MRTFKYLLLFVCLFLTSCSSSDRHKSVNEFMEDSGRLKVLATTAMIRDIVWRIGREHVDTLVLIQGEIDPHSYEMVKGDSEKLSRADLIFYNGLGLEHGASLKSQLMTQEKAISVGDYVKQHYPTRLISINGSIDPHIWLDISLWVEIIDPIVAGLCKKDAAHAAEFKKNAEVLKSAMLSSHQEVMEAFKKIPEERRYLVTSHDAFNYFTRAYLCQETPGCQWQDHYQAPEGLAPEGQLSVHDIQKIIDFIFDHHIEVVFPESNISQDALKKVVDVCCKKGQNVRLSKEALFADSMRQTEEGYLGMIWYNAKILISAWEGSNG